MSDWYTKGKEEMFKYISETTGVDELQVRLVYSEFNHLGLIDYDIEKDVIEEFCDE